MELTHKLTYNSTTYVIEEPAGFDGLKMTLKRHDYHGIGAEVSSGELEFYGVGHNVIKLAYDANIDAPVVYEVFAGTDVIYSGSVDLSTCSFLEGDYKSVSVKVGEIGIKTTFNNRVDKEVNLRDQKTIDGTLIPTGKRAVEYLLQLPTKQLCHTNRLSQPQGKSIVNPNTGAYFPINSSPASFNFLLDKVDKSEYGQINTSTTTDPLYSVDDVTEFRKQYGAGCTSALSGTFIATLHYRLTLDNGWQHVVSSGYPQTTARYYSVCARRRPEAFRARYEGNGKFKDTDGGDDDPYYTDVFLWNDDADAGGNGVIRFGVRNTYVSVIPSQLENYSRHTIELSEASVNAENSLYLPFKVDVDFDVYATAGVWFELGANSEFKMRMYDTIQLGGLYAQAYAVGDVLYQLCQTLTENSVEMKSGWLALPNAPQSGSGIGQGALKFIMNGYAIRGISRGLSVSFKSVIEALSALDCIGWGFATENGETVLRVERWEWFYKMRPVILTLSNVAEIKITAEPQDIITELTIGYKKYATTSEYDSIDSIHGERTFASKIKAVSNALNKTCDWIADNYAIEETRRAEKSVDRSEEFKYDENIFVFECMKRAGITGYEITHSATNVLGIDRPEEFINAMLSPWQMAARWMDYLFAANSASGLLFKSGKINSDASFGVLQSDANTTYLKCFADPAGQAENSDIQKQAAKFKAEKIEFSCPLTISQYEAVKANPYGLVSVNGKFGWIKDFSYSFQDGMADFTLIAKR